jgi:hypothetical protein
MKKEYRIYLVEKTGKFAIEYIGGNFNGLVEFYAYEINDPQTYIREGYTKHKDSL